MAERKLTPKQKKFCNEYLIDLNATQAAIRAGYSDGNIGRQLITKNNVSAYLSQRQGKLQEKTEITAERVIAELAKIGFANTQDFVNGNNSILELKHIDRDKTAAVSSVETTISESHEIVTTRTKLRFHDKVQALEKLGRHLGIFKVDNEQAPPPPPPAEIQVNLSHLTFEQLKELKYGKQ